MTIGGIESKDPQDLIFPVFVFSWLFVPVVKCSVGDMEVEGKLGETESISFLLDTGQNTFKKLPFTSSFFLTW